jgi:hypothetical protein
VRGDENASPGGSAATVETTSGWRWSWGTSRTSRRVSKVSTWSCVGAEAAGRSPSQPHVPVATAFTGCPRGGDRCVPNSAAGALAVAAARTSELALAAPAQAR